MQRTFRATLGSERSPPRVVTQRSTSLGFWRSPRGRAVWNALSFTE
ncbi:MAG TPA: hypothetical protein VGI70_10940 [Polyangiales bacterium]